MDPVFRPLMFLPGGTYAKATVIIGGTLIVQSGGSAFSDTISSGGTLTVLSGGSGSYITLAAGATFNVGNTYDNQHQASLTALSGTTINVLSGGTLLNPDAVNHGTINVSKGGVVSNAIISSGGGLTVSSGGTVSTATVNAGGSATFSAGASTSALTLNGGTIDTYVTPKFVAGGVVSGTLIFESGVSDGGYQKLGTGVTIQLKSGASLSNSTIGSGNNVTVSSGGTATGLVASSGGSIYAASGAHIGTTTVSSGATLSAAAGATLSGTVTTTNGAKIIIPTTAGGTVNLQGDSNVGLTITGSGSPTTVISGFSANTTAGTSDGITLESVKTADVVAVSYPDTDHVTFTLKDGSAVSLNIIGVKDVGYTLSSDSSGDLVCEVCFLADTLVAGPNGDTAVQNLVPGDIITSYRDGVTSSSRISWAGKAHCVIRPEKADDEAGYPVRIVKDAIALGVPFKDLLVTSEHCLFLDGKFIPARMLVNGRSIFFDKSFTSYDYFHIETEDHSVIVANGALTESYLDTGNRRAFRQEGNVFVLGQQAKSWETDAAAPLAVSRELVEPAYRLIEQRAQVLQFEIQAPAISTVVESDLHLVSNNGHRIEALRTVDGRTMFMIPDGVNSVQVVSNNSRPSDAIGPFVDDRRMLGVLVSDISFFDSGVTKNISTHLSDDTLSGWHDREHASMRWTNGNALLPLGERMPGSIGLLALKIEAAGPYVVRSSESVDNVLKIA
ncbi:Hint domain-containing protein [Gluconobacter thailandicus]|nr:Hint domain-containing protein [Gluconobacter thailandicus]